MRDVKVVASNVRALTPAMLGACTIAPHPDAAEGAVVVVEAVSREGSIRSVENQAGREVALYQGDRFVGVLANRRSSTSEYGHVPAPCAPGALPELDLLSHGGVIGQGLSIPPCRAACGFTKVKVLGALMHGGRAVFLRDLCSAPVAPRPAPAVPTILVCGSAAEVGKTTACTALIRALKRHGLSVGGAKLTGTGRLRDILGMRDAGADHVLDFPSVGLATTYTAPAAVLDAARAILSDLDSRGCDIVVAELGGDIIEACADHLLLDSALAKRTHAIVHVAGDVIGIIGAAELYRRAGLADRVHPTIPKDRNPLGTTERLRALGWTALDAMDAAACDAFVGRWIAGGDA